MDEKKPKKRRSTVKHEVRIQEAAQKVLEEGKSVQECANEMGIHRNHVTKLLHKAMSDEEVRSRVQRSKDRLVKMLSLADGAYLRILKYNHPENFSNQAKVATSIYKTMGLIREEPMMALNMIVPITVEVKNREYTIATGDSDTSTR